LGYKQSSLGYNYTYVSYPAETQINEILQEKRKKMVKRVQLVLNQDVSKLGKLGDLVEVAPGYARNYLIPKNLATHATPGILKQVERRREQERQRQLELRQQALEQKASLEKVTSLRIAKQVGENEAIFGTVTTQEIVDAIKAATGQEVDRRGITIPDINHLGTYKAEIKLFSEVTAQVDIEVVAS
jgi:large subunit ribosomal protein L9